MPSQKSLTYLRDYLSKALPKEKIRNNGDMHFIAMPPSIVDAVVSSIMDNEDNTAVAFVQPDTLVPQPTTGELYQAKLMNSLPLVKTWFYRKDDPMVMSPLVVMATNVDPYWLKTTILSVTKDDPNFDDMYDYNPAANDSITG